MGSMSHRRGGPGSSVHYAAAKGAVVTMTMGVAREFAAQGIRALSISPGPVHTPFQAAASSSPELVQRFLDDVPMKRFGEPEEIGELVLFMCSDACTFMTADTVYVNGGGGWR
jgi:3-oxoacyl-[acyl-carrier protein] reductase